MCTEWKFTRRAALKSNVASYHIVQMLIVSFTSIVVVAFAISKMRLSVVDIHVCDLFVSVSYTHLTLPTIYSV